MATTSGTLPARGTPDFRIRVVGDWRGMLVPFAGVPSAAAPVAAAPVAGVPFSWAAGEVVPSGGVPDGFAVPLFVRGCSSLGRAEQPGCRLPSCTGPLIPPGIFTVCDSR